MTVRPSEDGRRPHLTNVMQMDGCYDAPAAAAAAAVSLCEYVCLSVCVYLRAQWPLSIIRRPTRWPRKLAPFFVRVNFTKH